MSIQFDPILLLDPYLRAPSSRWRAGPHPAAAFVVFAACALLAFAAVALFSLALAVAVTAGLVCGHFADLFFGRLYTGSELGGSAYRCNDCRAPLRPLFGIPLLGTLAARLRCPDCGSRLPLPAVVLPVGAVALFAASHFVFHATGPTLLGGFFATAFLTLTLTDLDRRLLPNRIVYPCVLLAAAFCWAWPDRSVGAILLGGGVGIAIATGLLLLSLPFGKGAFGMGDVKMIVLIGFVTGYPAVVSGLLVGTLAAGAVALVLIITRLRGTRDYIPHGPFLALGGLIGLFFI